MTPDPTNRTIVRHIETGQTCCDPDWEEAYNRFETADQEIEKFRRRLRAFGLHRQPKQIRIVELFCGRGGGLVALEQLGFTRIEGVDLSESLLRQYAGDVAKLHLADCRDLPLPDDSFDAVIVQGGLHHLPVLPDDLTRVVREVHRVLNPEGHFYVVEPWLTPFLRFVHLVVQQRWVRRFYRKGDALAEMIEHERTTYEQWLGQPQAILDVFGQYFDAAVLKVGWGKIMFDGKPRQQSVTGESIG